MFCTYMKFDVRDEILSCVVLKNVRIFVYHVLTYRFAAVCCMNFRFEYDIEC